MVEMARRNGPRRHRNCPSSSKLKWPTRSLLWSKWPPCSLSWSLWPPWSLSKPQSQSFEEVEESTSQSPFCTTDLSTERNASKTAFFLCCCGICDHNSRTSLDIFPV